jgi:hypothetical protein
MIRISPFIVGLDTITSLSPFLSWKTSWSLWAKAFAFLPPLAPGISIIMLPLATLRTLEASIPRDVKEILLLASVRISA